MKKGNCKHLDYENNYCSITGGQCIGKDVCDDYEEVE